MTTDVYGTRYLLQVRPCRGGEACRKGIFWQERPSQCCEASSSCRLVFWIGGGVYGDINVKIGDDLVGSATAVTGLKW